MSTAICSWCSAPGTLEQSRTCLRCGAPLGVATVTDASGWQELPAIPNAARIHFGSSRAQIEGAYVPMVEVNLDGDEGLFFTHDMLMWKDGRVRISNHPMAGAFKRMRAGLPLVMMEAHGPGAMGLSHDSAGELIALPLQPGHGVYVAEHHLLAATTSTKYGAVVSPIQFSYRRSTADGYAYETERPLGWNVDTFLASDRPALVLLHAVGNAFTRTLAAGETVSVNPSALVAWDPTVTARVIPEFPGNTTVILVAQMTGPGRVIIQSGAHGHVLFVSYTDRMAMAQRFW